MTDPLPKLEITKKIGSERFHSSGSYVDFDVLDYWRWSSSDFVSNVTRGVLAEYIVARAVGVSTAGVRDDWAVFDLETPDGIKIEVKSAAYVQSWDQVCLSSINFGTPKTRAWTSEEDGHYSYSPDSRRQADIYVFALLAHRIKLTIDPLDLDQWEFYVLSTAVLDARGSQGSISLRTLETLTSPVTFNGLAEAVQEVYRET